MISSGATASRARLKQARQSSSELWIGMKGRRHNFLDSRSPLSNKRIKKALSRVWVQHVDATTG
jgi:hypothetical protein